MNVVGKVGSLITQGVYSVATPFHPFGGAVDIIVVQQQDGSFRSTPWYVQFGKFQGVLKGAEKVVRIKVNGVESNFHMNLDNSGEAYFVRDADFCESIDQKHVLKEPCLEHSFSVDNSQCTSNSTNNDSVDNFKLQSTLSDPGILRDEYSSFNRLERADSDACRFYDFQDDQSFDDSVELSSDYGSSRYDTMEAVESFVEAQGSDSEMVLVSVDGHILTAPISSSEQNAEIVQLDTPQFHLGPGKGNGFCREEREFSVTETTWDSEYLNDLESSSTKPNSDIAPANNNVESNVSSDNHVMIEKNAYQDREGDGNGIQQSEGFDDRHKLLSPESSNGEPIEGIINTIVECDDNRKSGFSGEGIGDNYEVDAGGDVEHIYEDDGVEENHLPEGLDEDRTQHSRSSSEQSEEDENPTLEISLCRHLLRSGMGLSAADEAFNAHRLSEEEFRSTMSSIIKNENLVIRYHKKYLPWNKAAPIVLGKAAFGLNLPVESEDAIAVEEEFTSNLAIHDSGSTSGRRWRLWPIPFRRGKTFERSTTNTSEEVFIDSESVSRSPSADLSPLVDSGTPLSETSPKFGFKKIVRTNIPTNEQISALNLKEGQNDVTFSFSTRVLGLQQVEAHIYLWKWNARIVISDVDGTITRSDVLGQFMPLVGKDWSQSGVARLFSAIKENGYQLLFLSARAIVQAYLTKSFLFNLKQDGKSLPNGPVVISPNGLFPSLFREVIRRAPHEFKIACLEDIKALFPPDYNPFYAGFGNRDTDELTYRKIGIPKGKIFIINPKGEVAINHRIDVKSYTSLHTLVNDMFPPTSMVEQEDFNAWNYWKMPLPDIVD